LCICAFCALFVWPMRQQNHRKTTNTQKTPSDGNHSTMIFCKFVYLSICKYPNAQFTSTGNGRPISSTGTITGTEKSHFRYCVERSFSSFSIHERVWVKTKILHMYSWVYNFSVFCSPGNQKNVCRMYQVHRHTPVMASSRQPQTINKRTMAVASGFDTTISNSFLGQISYLRRGNQIHCKHLLRPPNELLLHRRHGVAVFCWGIF
jgi:hypothetical protein